MPTKKTALPFTIQLPASLHAKLAVLQKRRKLASKTDTVIHAISTTDISKLKFDETEMVQISVRLHDATVAKLEKHAKRVGISSAAVVRKCLEAAR